MPTFVAEQQCLICKKNYLIEVPAEYVSAILMKDWDRVGIPAGARRLLELGSCPDCPVREVAIDLTCAKCGLVHRIKYTWAEATSGEEMLPEVCLPCYDELKKEIDDGYIGDSSKC